MNKISIIKFLLFDSRYVLSGSYGNVLRIFDRLEGTDWIYDLGETGLRPALPTASSSSSMSTPSLRPQRTRLQPKRFIFPDSDLGTRLGVSSVCLAHAASVDTIDPPPVIPPLQMAPMSPAAGSKRRKQVLNNRTTAPSNMAPIPCHRVPSPASSDDDEDDLHEDQDDEDDDDDEAEGEFEESNGHPNGENLLVTGLRQLDFTRKFLQVIWHPQRRMAVATCGNKMFMCQGKQLPPPLLALPMEERLMPNDLASSVEESSQQVAPSGCIGSPLDNIKAAKRRRWREKHHIFSPEVSPPPLSDFQAIQQTSTEPVSL